MALDNIYSLMFFTVYVISLILGVRILYINPNEKSNRLFYFLSISLCFWAFGFAISNMAATMEIALFWRRISAIGRTTIHAFLLHMIILITHNSAKVKKQILFIIYLPAILSLYAFSLSPNISLAQYNLVHTNIGWINIAVNNFWGIFFNSYYILYMLVNFILIYRWGKNSKDKNTKSQSDILLGALIFTLVLGVLTDVVLNILFKTKMPQLGPLLSLIPMVAVSYLVKKNNLLHETNSEEWDQVLSSESRVKLYFLTSVLFLIGGVINALQYFFPQLMDNMQALQSSIPVSVGLFLLGTLILIFQFIKKERLRDMLILLIAVLSIPIITLSYIHTASITIWVFPLILMVMSLIFDTKIPLLAVTLFAVITQLIVWKYAPKGPIIMDEIDFILRIGIILLAFGIGSVVNGFYIKKLAENTKYVNSQKLVSEASFDFIDINKSNTDNHINELLSRIGNFFDVDLSYIFMLNNQDNVMRFSYGWHKESQETERELLDNIASKTYHWFLKELYNEKKILIEDVALLPEDAVNEIEYLQKQKIKSTLGVPIDVLGNTMGFIGCASTTTPRIWLAEEVELLQTMANMLSSTFVKIKAEEEIEFLAYYDHLTGLPNRTLFVDRATQALKNSKRKEYFLAVIFIDIDSFKMINDTMGHGGGDKLLIEIANQLRKTLRDTDTIARFGGDEFLILLNNMSKQEDIVMLSDKIMNIFTSPFSIDEHEFFITASAGIAISTIDGDDVETLIKNADIAMYEAKYKGKNQYVFCTKDLKEDLQRNMTLSNHLFRAIEKNELMVYYQPQINIQTGKINGLEALLRWKHPEFGMIPPNTFIPLAEKSGLINTIGEWVLREALTQNKTWHDKGLFKGKIAVNLSPIQFNDVNIVEKIATIISESRLEPKYLDLEITESIAVKESAYIIGILNRLKDLGVSISIDDFGTEYSSLSRLKILPVDKIKIDMQFIQGIDGSKKDQAITKIIINLAKSLKLNVIAEGVETSTQLNFLNQRMCDDAQGFFYYKPMPAEELEKIFTEKAILSTSKSNADKST